MAHPWIRRALDRAGLLGFARSLNRGFHPPEPDFSPCTPHLLIAVNKALRRLQGTPLSYGSDYFEFGIYRGFTLWYAQALAGDLGFDGLRFFGFDSFAGLPAPTGVDASGQREAFYEGAFRTPRAYVEKKLAGLAADFTKVFLVEGFFDQTLVAATREKLGLRRCALCVIDCDLYESARQALVFIEPLIVDGTIILFDDWRSYGDTPSAGEQRAFRELLARNPRLTAERFVDFHDHGKGFIMKLSPI